MWHKSGAFHFHTGRPLADWVGYPAKVAARLPDSVVESFAGVHCPFAMGMPGPGETVVDVGSGAGFDSVIAGLQVGPEGRVIGIDMTHAMVEKARSKAAALGLEHVTFRQGYAEQMPVDAETADLVISNGVINLSVDRLAVFREIYRVVKPGGRIQIADIVSGLPLPEKSRSNLDLWTG